MKKRRTLFLILVLLTLLLGAQLALAQSGYQLAASTVAGGGGSLQSGNYGLTGTSGQPEAYQQYASGAYSLYGGFWHAIDQEMRIFFPRVIR